jgi:hypothetical protein
VTAKRSGSEDHGSSSDDWARLSRQNELEPADVTDINTRLDRMDARSSTGPWTRAALELIERHPGIVSTELAKKMEIERYAFKAQVRKLKRLGLTHSLEVGYELSPRGHAYRQLTT